MVIISCFAFDYIIIQIPLPPVYSFHEIRTYFIQNQPIIIDLGLSFLCCLVPDKYYYLVWALKWLTAGYVLDQSRIVCEEREQTRYTFKLLTVL